MTWLRRFLLLAVLFLPLQAHAVEADASGKVLWIYDGDTLKVEGIGKVRLIGIDAPEKEGSDRDRHYLEQGISRERLRGVADEALAYLVREVKGRTVVLEPGQDDRDRHGRRLAYVYLPDGRLLNRVLLEKGLAAVYRRFDFRLKEDFLEAERKAREDAVGLWE